MFDVGIVPTWLTFPGRNAVSMWIFICSVMSSFHIT